MKTVILAALWLSFTGSAFLANGNNNNNQTQLKNINSSTSCFQDTVPKRNPTHKPSKTPAKKQSGKDTTRTRQKQDTMRRY